MFWIIDSILKPLVISVAIAVGVLLAIGLVGFKRLYDMEEDD